MAIYRARSIRRARSLTARIAGAAVIILVSFLGTVALLIDPIERGGKPMLFLLFAGVIALATLLGMIVARTQSRVLADLIERGAPWQAYPRDAMAVARAVAAPDAATSASETPPQQPAEAEAEPQTAVPPAPAADVHEDFWGPGSKPDLRGDEPLFRDRPDAGTTTSELGRVTEGPAPTDRPDGTGMNGNGGGSGGMRASGAGLYDDDPPTEPVQTIVLPAGDPAYHAAAANGHRHDVAAEAAPSPSNGTAGTSNATAALVHDLDDIVAKLRRIAQRDTP